MNRLKDKVAIITGAGSGIGRSAAELMGAQGARVVVADHDASSAEDTARAVEEAGGQALPYTVDVMDDTSVGDMVEAAVRAFGRLDVLCNHVGGTNPRKDLDLLRLDMDEFGRAVDLNVRSTLTGSRHAVPHMIRAGGGSIINTASVAGLVGDVLQISYGAVKAAVVNITKSIAVQYGPQGIRCNAVAPGTIMTPALLNNLPAEVIEALKGYNSLPYLGAPEDIGHTMVFLASDESRYLTGQLLVVDGGMTSQSPAVPGRRAMLPSE
ncbi:MULTISPECIES: SDR family NAD(P)-dependent oxidoreductase [unclassified Streptomyces]|uniref:SDR family NAD(P)-dependent oxidoreductase n=1 Tax=unclassified Streptomyces TaxID=2593676 RepID=UPI00081AFABD|nr:MULTISPECIES: SDR family NAD(P)-dependent oxidoreductase [unclassified Streptomyces]MYU32728.1 glucose 1-dehydrogenase [Streptomyces sp. SID8358]MYX73140.1 glucose 1-dehydrogenase [Streptomyces sp. SID3915]SCD69034.1 NAD(P)-dependent dehydrogenase, short-chain alcohol dehydrogenase family [Streptomyces sp. BpilaLS-43]